MMKFNPRAKIDRSQIKDRRGQGGRGGGGLSGLPGLGRGGGGGGGLAIPTGGGIGAIVILIIVFVVATQSGALNLGGLTGDDGSSSDQGATLDNCNDGSDADQQDCRIAIDVNAIQSFWTGYLPQAASVDYQEADTVYLAGSTSTGCGQATSAMGPFYCPNDTNVYLDLTFFDDMLQGQLGASGGEFQEAYVLAHEYGHHIQDLLGTLGKHQSSATGPTSESVRIELQADCYAGIWTHYATTAKDADGEVFITEISDQDILDAIDAATAVGDDRIQQETSGRVNPDQWTHGSAAERVQWFQAGFRPGQLKSCDPFAPGAL